MKFKTILWDFDGVILDSMQVRDFGFREIFKDFKPLDVDKLIDYHRYNGGLSRYVKIRYFFEEIIGRATTEQEILEYASRFSDIMLNALVDQKNLIKDSVSFIKGNYNNYKFHIVSGSDQEELRFLCKALNLDKYFLSIEGSPTAKSKLVKDIIIKHNYAMESTCLIGDSINDFEAADNNEISFFGYNNETLKELSPNYISTFRKDAIKLN
ncbi:HAD family hydrolase [Winogradskyella endarachnes]|uniref:phosphoglycolate phosphatase n=1 Tax=Winogradskyella endarachnes TaxID=2681965 RepID=A0A6L6U9Y1_9FLAO|nr:HAD hydrolase-like protein [Winogradskyella endarachnes]MUU79063.1 HAD hydrolase-like protein [Winogradskyella endarachnes]